MTRMPDPRTVLCEVGIVEAKDVRDDWDPCRDVYEHLDNHREQIEMFIERENPVDVSFVPVASQQKEYMLDKVLMVGWKIALS